MAGFRAVKASTSDQVFDAVKGNCPVIAVDNKNLFKKIKEISEHDLKMQKSADNFVKGGAISVGSSVALVAIGGVAETFFWPIGVVCGLGFLATSCGGILSALVGAGKKVWANMSAEMKDYKWFESGKYLILYKYKGNNKFDPEKDTVEIKEEA